MATRGAQAKRGFETGVPAIADMDEAKSKLNRARSQLVTARNDPEIKRSELDKLVGNAPEVLAALAPRKVVPRPQPEDPAVWIARSRGIRADAGRGRFLRPQLQLQQSHPAAILLDTCTVPYGGGAADHTDILRGQTGSQVAEAIANRYKARAELEEAKRKAAADARQAYAGIVSGQPQIEALESAVAAGEGSVKGCRIGYRSGIRINSDVLDAKQHLYSSRRDLAKARYDTLLQGLRLKATAGLLTESDLVTINALLVEPQSE